MIEVMFGSNPRMCFHTVTVLLHRYRRCVIAQNCVRWDLGPHAAVRGSDVGEFRGALPVLR